MTSNEERVMRSEIRKTALSGKARLWPSLRRVPTSAPQERSSSLAPRSSPLAPRPGVTLVELLIVIAIIAILAAMLIGLAAVAMTTAREARTRNIVTRLHSLLAEQYDSYKVRRVKLNPNVQNLINTQFPNPNQARQRGEALAQARLYALRELMLMEMPDRWSDVAFNQVGNPAKPNPLYYYERTGLSALYARQYERLRTTTNTISGATNTAADIAANQGAECLYLVIMNATGEGEARSQFGEADIGDTDGDGAPEFLDGWGRPIEYLRWAPGFVSDLQHNPYEFADQQAWQLAADADHDPFDVFRRDRFAFRLQPLIYSAGNDERYGIERNDAGQVWYTAVAVTPDPAPFYFRPRLTPYELGSLALYTGTTIDRGGTQDVKAEDATDNIHNQLIDANVR